MQLQGQLQTIPLPELAQIIGTGRKSGTLEIRGDSQTVRLVFRDGGLLGVLWEQDDAGELARLLVDRGLLDRLELEAVLDIASRRRQSLDSTLRELGLLRAEDLRRLLEERVALSFAELLEWRSGDFDFRPPRDDEHLEGAEAIAVDRLLLSAIA